MVKERYIEPLFSSTILFIIKSSKVMHLLIYSQHFLISSLNHNTSIHFVVDQTHVLIIVKK
ncbi:hypothetical protein DICVIV_09914 [Dictyocaulus viviparus]|uniref:Uncharacterized protein n=1 Tax=Dictyocaulus viviparus TaxID=29172 RepID=A0A0D8XJQ8_DICVI|nr:hypothetical protein DICVIV_09914 [Dictyocaulus viviparus]